MLDFFMQVQEPSGGGGGTGTGAYNSEEYNFPSTPTHIIGIGRDDSTQYTNNGRIVIYDFSSGALVKTADYSTNDGILSTSLSRYGDKKCVVKDGYAYIASSGGGIDVKLNVIDVSDPNTIGASQVVASIVVDPNRRYTAQISAHPTKNILWIFTESGNDRTLFTVDISNPSNPSIIGSAIVDVTSLYWDTFFSDNGEYFYTWFWGSSSFAGKIYTLNASNEPTFFQNLTPPYGASNSDMATFAVSPRTGDKYYIVSQTSRDILVFHHLGGDYVEDSYSVHNDPTNLDNVKLIRNLNYITNYDPSADLAIAFLEQDDNSIGISTYTGNTLQNVANVNYVSGLTQTLEVSENNLFTGSSTNIRIWEWSDINTVSLLQNELTTIGYYIADLTVFAP